MNGRGRARLPWDGGGAGAGPPQGSLRCSGGRPAGASALVRFASFHTLLKRVFAKRKPYAPFGRYPRLRSDPPEGDLPRRRPRPRGAFQLKLSMSLV